MRTVLLMSFMAATVLGAPSERDRRQSEPYMKFSESVRMNVAHSREFSASFQHNGQPTDIVRPSPEVQPTATAPQSFVNWQQTLKQFVPNVMKFNANYNNNWGPGDVSAFGFGPLGLPMPSINRGGQMVSQSGISQSSTTAEQFPRFSTQKPQMETKPLVMVEKFVPNKSLSKSAERFELSTTTSAPNSSGSAERSLSASREVSSKPLSPSTSTPQYGTLAAYWVF